MCIVRFTFCQVQLEPCSNPQWAPKGTLTYWPHPGHPDGENNLSGWARCLGPTHTASISHFISSCREILFRMSPREKTIPVSSSPVIPSSQLSPSKCTAQKESTAVPVGVSGSCIFADMAQDCSLLTVELLISLWCWRAAGTGLSPEEICHSFIHSTN